MNLSKLLATRQALLRQTQLANLAYTYATLQQFAARVHRANLHGRVRLRPAEPTEERYWATLTALDGAQSVLDEHFTENDIGELAEAVAFGVEGDFPELEFRLEDVGDRFATPIRQMLEQCGVVIDDAAAAPKIAADNAD